MTNAMQISHLEDAHGLADRTLVECLASTTAESIAEFLGALHEGEHALEIVKEEP
jgi:hypothetical protein